MGSCVYIYISKNSTCLFINNKFGLVFEQPRNILELKNCFFFKKNIFLQSKVSRNTFSCIRCLIEFCFDLHQISRII